MGKCLALNDVQLHATPLIFTRIVMCCHCKIYSVLNYSKFLCKYLKKLIFFKLV